jgi:DNA invertase Pin-like site-specific DNA recombinase
MIVTIQEGELLYRKYRLLKTSLFHVLRLTSTAGGRLVFHIFGSIAEFERAIIRERTNGSVQDTCKNRSQGGWPSRADTFGDLSNDAAAGLAVDFLVDLPDAEVG